jgi:hypothetical protein
MADPHLKAIRDVTPSAEGCLRIGSDWVHLRLRLTCGHVGCCDSSPHRHARQHFHRSGHPIIQSFEPGEDWRWCYVDQAAVWNGTDQNDIRNAGKPEWIRRWSPPVTSDEPPAQRNPGV